MSQAASTPSRRQLRLRSLAWALGAGASALLLGLPLGLESALRAGGCGLFYGLLAFHLQRVDPDDGHLQAGLVGAVCGIHSLGLPAISRWPAELALPAALMAVTPAVMMGLIRAWLPLVGAALVLHGFRLVAQRVPPSRSAGPPGDGQASTHRP
ncbi:MAG: hypothetical protein AAFX65_04540 [Cyanobacteria bacterium J06638_7]